MFANGNISFERRVLATNRISNLNVLILSSWTSSQDPEAHESFNACKYIASTSFSEQQSLQDDFEDLQ